MSNPFRFKQFSIKNNLASMKVGTDAVLLGAWANLSQVDRILDIGTGTGILALMSAQRNPQARLIGIDIEANAIIEAKTNVNNSEWKDRICILKSSIQEFNTEFIFDYIICNPPFFEFTNQSPKLGRQLAREHRSLDLDVLAYYTSQLLNEKGAIGMVYPFEAYDKVIEAFNKNHLYLNRELRILPTPQKPIKRFLAEFSKEKKEIVTDNLIIEDQGRHGYSKRYKELTKDFYLNF